MPVELLTPLGGLLALVGVLPLAGLLGGEARARAVAVALGLPEGPPPRAAVAAVAGVAVLLGLAAAQPVLELEDARAVRTDAEVFVVVDTSRSMLAASSVRGETRLDRARTIALRVRAELDDVPVGVASFTDRVLPHLFPTADSAVYAATLERTVDVEQPPPDRSWAGRATSFEALSSLAAGSFYAGTATSRVAVLLTDGETRPYELQALAETLARPPGIVPIAVHVWRDGERIYRAGRLDRGYAADPGSRRALSELVEATGGAAFGEDDADAAARAARSSLGEGDRATAGRRRSARPLAPWLALAAAFPLAFLVGRRVI